MKRFSSTGDLKDYRDTILAGQARADACVYVCMTGCRAYGAGDVKDALEREIKKSGLAGRVEVRSTGCHGFCAKAPVLAIDPLGIQYQGISPEDAPEIVETTLMNNRLIDRLAYRDLETGRPVFHRDRIPFTQSR